MSFFKHSEAQFLVHPNDLRETFEDAFGVSRNRHDGQGKEQAREYIQNFASSDKLTKQTFQTTIEGDDTQVRG